MPVFEDARDHGSKEAQHNEIPGNAQEHRQPPIHLMENEADDRHQEDGWNEQESSEGKVDFEPMSQPSIWANPVFDAQDEIP